MANTNPSDNRIRIRWKKHVEVLGLASRGLIV
jgi:hypothetical protein